MMNRKPPVIVTGAAGFIGHATAHRLLDRGDAVIGVDNFNDYYDPQLKDDRAATLAPRAGFSMERLDVADAEAFGALVRKSGAVRIVHLAAQAGVRYSIDHPFSYEHSNMRGHLAVIEAARHQPGFEHLVYASSSSVYGDRPEDDGAFRESDRCDNPVSLYAASKKACELMSAAYSRLYALPQSGLRFFTVYGPWGRPDMAYFSFTQKILAREPIPVFGEGEMARDFTFIDDIVDGILGTLDRPPPGRAPRILNIGDSNPVGLMEMIRTLENALGCQAVKIMHPMQPGDVTVTYADVTALAELTGYEPQVMLGDGLRRFVAWYLDYYDVPQELHADAA